MLKSTSLPNLRPEKGGGTQKSLSLRRVPCLY
jgi:hypothetical protein